MGLGVAVECEAQDGYHFNEADLLLEIVDPQTGETVPPGEEGELIFTTLTRESMPLLRYRTHDLSRFITEPCRCGTAGLLKIDKVKKRLESIVAIGDDDIVYPSYFDDALYEIPGVVDYQVVLSRSGTRDRLQFTVEMAPGRTSAIDELVQKLFSEPLITRNLAAGRLEKPTVEIAEWGRFRSAGRTKKLIADQR
jgi:phenylacetate-coenzyme A ligase PaaK-like adenylate-forming protein